MVGRCLENGWGVPVDLAQAAGGDADIRRTIAATLGSAAHPELRRARARALGLAAADARVTSAVE